MWSIKIYIRLKRLSLTCFSSEADDHRHYFSFSSCVSIFFRSFTDCCHCFVLLVGKQLIIKGDWAKKINQGIQLQLSSAESEQKIQQQHQNMYAGRHIMASVLHTYILKSASGKIIVRLLETMKLTKYNCANAPSASSFHSSNLGGPLFALFLW